MIAAICKWFEARRVARLREQHRQGYAWAAGELLSARMTPGAVENLTGIAMTLEGPHPFDTGARKALNDYVRWPERLAINIGRQV